MSEDLYSGPSVLAPGAPKRPDALARWLVWPLLLALLLMTIVFYVLFSPLQVVGDSMLPTLVSGDRVLRTKSYESPRRGDVVIIHPEASSDDDDVVKRVVALEGDVVEIVDDVAYVNGAREGTADALMGAVAGTYRLAPVTVPPGHVYVLGDNRPVSLDSRYLGPIPLTSVRGRASFVFLPLSRLGPIE